VRCPQCGHENRSEARFCEECSARLAACPSCGRANRPTANYCDKCGAILAAEAVAEEHAAAVSPGQAPSFVTERIQTRRSAREGERKLVTVLFADVADSSHLAQQLDPEVLHEVLDGVLRLVAEVVHRYDGTVSHYMGDGLMALFGAPVAVEDHALRAVLAGLEMQEVIGKRGEQLERERGIKLRLRVGLDTGQVVVGLIGDRMRMDYTAMGNTAHVAARMEAMAEPGTVLVTETTWQAAAGGIEAERVGPVEVRGQHKPVVVYRVTGRTRQLSRLARRGRNRWTKLIGRGEELQVLHRLLAAAIAGTGQAVAIAGDAGLGKSRLVHEFRQAIEPGRVAWLEGGCVAHGQGVPYAPILEILSGLFGIDDGDEASAIRSKLRERIDAIGVEQERLPLLEFLFAVPGADEAVRGLDPRARRERTWEAVIEVLAAASRRPALGRSEFRGFSRVSGRAARCDADPVAGNAPAGQQAALGGIAGFHPNRSRSSRRRRIAGNDRRVVRRGGDLSVPLALHPGEVGR
jgi:class 3 adenylate cyclase